MRSTALKLTILSLVFVYSLSGVRTLANPSSQGGIPQPSAASLLPEDPWISKYIPVRESDLEDSNPAAAYSSKHNEFLVVWEEHTALESIIYGRRVGLDGETKGKTITIAVAATGIKFIQPDVIYLPDRDQYWVYFTAKFDSTTYHLKCVTVSGDGADLSIIEIPDVWPWNWYPALAYNPKAGEVLVAYEKYSSSATRYINALIVNPVTKKKVDLHDIAGVMFETRRLPDVVYNKSLDQYLIAYSLQAPSTAKSNIVGKLVSGDRDWFSSERSIASASAVEQDGVSLAAGEDEYLAVWQEVHNTNQTDIWGKRMKADGTLSPFIKIASTPSKKHSEPATAYGNDGYYLAVWRHEVLYSSTPYWKIFGRYLQVGQDTPAGSEFQIEQSGSILSPDQAGWAEELTSSPNYTAQDQFHQKNPAAACAGNTACLVVFENSYPGPDYDIGAYLVGLHQRTYLPVVISK